MMKNIMLGKWWMILFIFLLSCVDEIDIEKFVGKPTNTLVVAGGITDRPMEHTIRLTRTTDVIPKGAANVVTDAIVSVSDGTTTYQFMEDLDAPGNYRSQSDVHGVPGNVYTLTVIADDITYTASDRMPEPVGFDDTDRLGFSYDGPNTVNGYVQRSLVQYGVAAPGIVSIELQDAGPDVNPSLVHYYALQGIDPDNVFPKFTEAIPFRGKSTFRQTKYAISDEHQRFLRAMLLETEYYGGFFGSVRANVPSNVQNGQGFFSACSVKERFVASR